MNTPDPLTSILKKKGTGHKMGVALSSDEIAQLNHLFCDDSANIITKATLLTALLMLPPNDEEKKWIDQTKHSASAVPIELHSLLNQSDASHPWPIIYSLLANKDLDKNTATTCFNDIVNQNISPIESAIILEALRLKRETIIENESCLNSLRAHSITKEINTDSLITISDPYDGFNRHLYLTPFSACLLASIGYPTLIHGIDSIGPKNGINSHKLLTLANKSILSMSDLCTNLETPSIAWGYLDQTISTPSLIPLKSIRDTMIKRPLLATLDKLIFPIKSKTHNIAITSVTHPPYKKKVAHLLTHTQHLDQWIVTRGIEGSTQPDPSKRLPVITANSEGHFRPEDCGVNPLSHEQDFNITTDTSLQAGLEALNNKAGLAKETILAHALMIVCSLNLDSKETAFGKLKNSLETGQALAHWNSHP